MTPEGLGAMTTIIDWLMKRPDSADFREPLDWRGLGLNDYPKVIEKPMDLGTVKQNIKRYRTIHHCADDIRLIWSNCKKYNGEGSVYYSLADSLSKTFEEYFDVARYGPCIKTEKRGRDADQSEEASKKMRKSINDVAADLVCPITQELPSDPVMAEDGKIYERNAILEWFSEKGARITSPSTNARMGTRLLPAVQTRNTIRTLIESGAIEGELAAAWQKKLADEKEVKAMRAKAEGGDGYAMFRLGNWYYFGMNGLAKDDVQARMWYHRSAAARDPNGMAAFGAFLLLGEGGPKNTSLGLVYITDAAHLGSEFGAYLLGDAFVHGKHGLSEGRVLPPSTAKVQARFWLKKIVDGECKFNNLTDEARDEASIWLRRMDAGVR
jgi:hypothetical protein